MDIKKKDLEKVVELDEGFNLLGGAGIPNEIVVLKFASVVPGFTKCDVFNFLDDRYERSISRLKNKTYELSAEPDKENTALDAYFINKEGNENLRGWEETHKEEAGVLEAIIEKVDYVISARDFAKKMYEYQKRDDKVTPYIKHPEAVFKILRKIGVRNIDVLAAAWLHDIIEETGVDSARLNNKFREQTVEYVVNLTYVSGTKEDYIERILKSDRCVQLIKLADFASNTSDMATVSKEKRSRMLYMAHVYYLPLAKKVCLPLYMMIEKNLAVNKQH